MGLASTRSTKANSALHGLMRGFSGLRPCYSALVLGDVLSGKKKRVRRFFCLNRERIRVAWVGIWVSW